MSYLFESLEPRTFLAVNPVVPALARPPSRIAPLAAPAAASTWTLRSPNSQLTANITLDASGRLSFTLDRPDAHVLAPSPLGITLAGAGGDFTAGLQLVSQSSRSIDETFALISGKSSTSRNRASESTLTFRNPAGRTVQLIARAYDDGFAYRYTFPGSGAAAVTSEASGFRLPVGSTGWLQPYVNNYEAFYNKGRVGTDFKTGDFGYPALFQTPSGSWALLTEAAISGAYGATRLTASGTGDGLFRVKLPDAQENGTLPWSTPWRVAIAGGSLATIVASTLVENLSPPSVIADTSWIKPGRSAWSWWSDHNSGANFNTQKAYVDLAARMGWEYSLVDEKWDAAWLPSLVQYANTKNVGIIIWTDWVGVDTAAERNAKLPLWKSWGVKGIKVDFMLSDSQARMKFYDDITQAALANKLMINFHGATIPHGQRRTYPNVMSFEAVNGAEQYTYTNAPTPSFNTVLPFTRNVVGPMDYTPVTFSAKNRRTTAAHELALSVVYESGWQHFADSAASYGASPAKPFLQAVPANWDETRFLNGYPGEFAALVRRKGSQWFLGAINAGTARSLNVPLTFLAATGSYTAQIYKDGTTGTIAVSQQTVKSTDTLKLDLPVNGGYAIRFIPVSTPPPPPPTNGLTATYFDNMDLTGPFVTRTDLTLNFNWGTNSPAPGIASDTFSARWAALLRVPVTSDYTLSLTSDDGVRLWLDNQLLINDWNPHAPKENRVSVHLDAGRAYSLRIEYFNRAGGASISLAWARPGVAMETIPSSALTPV
jgi:hypothetical protein